MSRENNCNPLPELIKELEQWHRTPLGLELLAQEKCALEQLLPALFGYYLLHIGPANGLGETLSYSHIRTWWTFPRVRLTSLRVLCGG